jgi:hypothetical protein
VDPPEIGFTGSTGVVWSGRIGSLSQVHDVSLSISWFVKENEEGDGFRLKMKKQGRGVRSGKMERK